MKSPHDRKPWWMRFIEREPVRFVLAGSLNTVTTYATYLVLLPLIGYTIAYSVAYAAGILFAYYLSARFVFRRPLQWRQAVQYPLVYLAQYVLGITLMMALVQGAHVGADVAPAMVIVITLPKTFWKSRWIIKRGQRTDSAHDASSNSETRADASDSGESPG
jgi:putative flippase GtrA